MLRQGIQTVLWFLLGIVPGGYFAHAQSQETTIKTETAIDNKIAALMKELQVVNEHFAVEKHGSIGLKETYSRYNQAFSTYRDIIKDYNFYKASDTFSGQYRLPDSMFVNTADVAARLRMVRDVQRIYEDKKKYAQVAGVKYFGMDQLRAKRREVKE